MDLNKDNMKKIMLLIVFAVLLFVGVQRFDIILASIGFIWRLMFPFAVGAAIAFILNVPMHCLEDKLFSELKKKKSRWDKLARPISMLLAILLVVAVVLLVVLVVAPDLAATLVSIGKSIEENIPAIQRWGMKTFSNIPQITEWISHIDVSWEKMIDAGINLLKTGVSSVLSSTLSVTMGLVNVVVNIFIGFIFACYILLNKEKLEGQIKKAMYALFSKKQVEYGIHVCKIAYKTFSNFITGQCIEAVILGTMFFVAMSLFRFPYALLVGVLIAFTALIPIFGAFIGCAVGVILILMVSPMKALMFLLMFLLLQQIEGNLIYPHVVGNSVGLPSIWVLVAVTVGGSLMGIVGMLIFIPLVSVVYALFREWVYKSLRKKKIQISDI